MEGEGGEREVESLSVRFEMTEFGVSVLRGRLLVGGRKVGKGLSI